MTCYTTALSRQQMEKLRGILHERGWEERPVPHALFAASGPKVQVVAYESGKCVVQGNGTAEFVEFTLEPLVLERAELGYEAQLRPEVYAEHIGVDESGKGDFFGPLVIAGVHATQGGVHELVEMGVRDSKKITSERVLEDFYKKISGSNAVTREVIVLAPEKYNELQRRMRTVNEVLGWAHATVAKKLLERFPQCRRAVFDQFAKSPRTILKYLGEAARGVDVVQRHRAEEDPVVAAASIVARRFFLKSLAEMSQQTGEKIPPGASAEVKETARKLLKKIGQQRLSGMVKTHFKTWQELDELF